MPRDATAYDLLCHEVALQAQCSTILVEPEELQMDKAAMYIEGLDRAPTQISQPVGHLLRYEITEVKLLVDDVHDAGRPYGHALKERIALAVHNGVVGADVAGDELLDDVVTGLCLEEESLQLLLVVDLVGASGADAYIGFGYQGIAHLAFEA